LVLLVLLAPQGSAFPAAICLVFLTVITCAVVASDQGTLPLPGAGESGQRLFTAFWGVTLFIPLIVLIMILGLWSALVVLALLATNVVFFYLLPSLSFSGRGLLDEVAGFKEFLTAVDSDRLQRMDAPPKTTSLFEKFLPYALALGVEEAWTRQFEGVLAQAAAAGTASTTAYSPAWLRGEDWSSFDSGRFAVSFSNDFSSAISSATNPPGSSSGFDDGGSGGGGGGGGGGGW
jgi:uncharacterized membrane protein